MTTQQPEALRLADALADYTGVTLFQMDQAAAELRRLHSVNAQLLEALEQYMEYEGTTPLAARAIAAAKGEA